MNLDICLSGLPDISFGIQTPGHATHFAVEHINMFLLVLSCIDAFVYVAAAVGAFDPPARCIAFLSPEAACGVFKFFVAESLGLKRLGLLVCLL